MLNKLWSSATDQRTVCWLAKSVIWSTLAVASGAEQSLPAAEPTKPNIVIIIADDLGYSDVGFQGGRQIPTPHLDRLAQTGTRLTNGYVSCPVCSPTRAGLATGRYQQRFGHEFNPGQPKGGDAENIGLPLTEVTLASLVQKGGYRTGLIGKWHLGNSPKFHPLSRGFDEFFGFLGAPTLIRPTGSNRAAEFTAAANRSPSTST